MLYAYTVTPLKEDHFKERVDDIKEMYQKGITVMPLFCMTLVPEGDPVWDKAGPMAELFCRYRDALRKEYVAAFRESLRAQLDNTYIQTPDGRRTRLKPKK